MSSKSKAILSYLGMYFTGILFLAAEKKDEFVRKSAAQSFVLSVVAMLFRVFFSFVPIIGSILVIIFDIFFMILLLFLIIKASKNIYFKLPFISDLSEKYVLDWFK